MAWLSGYTWRKQITINHTDDGAQTNYQLLLNIVQGAGTDSGNTVYLESKALDWPKDIRFTKSDGTTLLDFWREESDATDGTWWIEFDAIPASPDNGTFYLYYGKASDTDASNGANTFPVFDDFSGDLALWNIVGAVVISAGICQITGADSVIDSKTQFGLGYSVRTYAKTVTIGDYGMAAQWRDQPETVYARFINHSGYSTTYECANDQVGDTVTTLAQNTVYHIREVSRITSSAVKYYADNALLATRTNDLTSADRAGARANGKDVYVDWILVRKITLNEPTFGTWGAALTTAIVGGGSLAMAGTLSTIQRFIQAVGGGSIAIAGELGRKIFIGVGSGTLSTAGTLNRLTRIIVGGGAVTIAGNLNRIIKIGIGGGAVTMAGSLTTTLRFFQAVGSGTVAIYGMLSTSVKRYRAMVDSAGRSLVDFTGRVIKIFTGRDMK